TRRAGLHHPPAPARLLFSTAPRPPSPTLFPYTTLFRSRSPARHRAAVLLSDAVHNAGPDPRPLARRFPRLHVLLETDGEHDAPLAADLARLGRGGLAAVATHRDVAPALNRLLA